MVPWRHENTQIPYLSSFSISSQISRTCIHLMSSFPALTASISSIRRRDVTYIIIICLHREFRKFKLRSRSSGILRAEIFPSPSPLLRATMKKFSSIAKLHTEQAANKILRLSDVANLGNDERWTGKLKCSTTATATGYFFPAEFRIFSACFATNQWVGWGRHGTWHVNRKRLKIGNTRLNEKHAGIKAQSMYMKYLYVYTSWTSTCFIVRLLPSLSRCMEVELKNIAYHWRRLHSRIREGSIFSRTYFL